MLARDANEERAFPVTIGQTDEDLQGMSLRDWFAGQALAGMNWRDSEVTYEKDAEMVFRMADAMMEARKK